MFILSRVVDQSIMIGNDIEIYVVEINDEKVRLGVKMKPSDLDSPEAQLAVLEERFNLAMLRSKNNAAFPNVACTDVTSGRQSDDVAENFGTVRFGTGE